uniref:Cordon-bleu WH2 repeat protein n=2 Tax=Nothobranchius furzeri TaxID=105023 RepID=A0A1A8B7W3_NOTFU|nr:protein cordon-bleu isoform X1 [Nothobranchius furzeri]
MSSKPPSGRRMKVHAPPPPQVPQPAPRNLFRNSAPDGGGASAIDAKENLLKPTVDVLLTLPHGYQTSVTEDGSKALMDLLVEVCSRHQLNPSLHTLELLSPEGHSLGFKPNALLGSLNVACVLIKEKVAEEKAPRRPAPKVPEKTVRLMVNYHGNQKAVVRVNPLVPLQTLTPVICEKCDFDPEHVLLLKDGVSRHELKLDKSLTELGIKELYAHDKSLVFQLKMASAPALNYSDSVCSSTTSLGRPQKKGFLNIFQFSRRKSKTETRSMSMDDFDDDKIQNTDSKYNGLSTSSGVPNMGVQPGCLGQSQSVTDIPRMSSAAETKKRRAPAPPGAPTPSLGQTSLTNDQVGLEIQRKRKAPAPPLTPTSFAQDSDEISAPAVLTLDHHTSEIPTPACRNKVAQSTTVSEVTVDIQTVKPSPRKRTAQPPPVCDAAPTPRSPSPSSSTTDSLAAQDSSSEFSRSLGDSDVDLEQAGSFCSTSSTASSSVQVQTTTKDSSSSPGQDVNPDSSSGSDTGSALNLKLDEVENNRHSGMAWLHSSRSSSSSVQRQQPFAPEAETLSLDSSGVCSILPDQGSPPSEGMAEGEDSGIVSSPSDTQPASPDESLSVDGRTEDIGKKLLEPQMDTWSDSDEGCATWRPKQRHDTNPQEQSVNGSEDDSELTAQLHQTLADLEADLADHADVSASDTSYTESPDSNDVPVSLVDMYVPVTAIDEVLEDYECNDEYEVKPHTKTSSTGSKEAGFRHDSDVVPQNQNNNAYTAAASCRKSGKNDKKSEQGVESQESQLTDGKKEEMTQKKNIADTNMAKDDKNTMVVKSDPDIQKKSETVEINPEHVKMTRQKSQQQETNLSSGIQRSLLAENNKEIQRASQTSSSFSSSHGKITPNVTSRFGLKTFTVVPPKPSVIHLTQPAVTLSNGAIKIDDQGNMVTAGFSHNKVSRSSDSESNKGGPHCEKAQLFWSSNEKQENVITQRKGLIEKAEDSTGGLETKSRTSNTEQTLHSSFSEPVKIVQPKVVVKGKTEEHVKDITAANKTWAETESKSSVSNSVQVPSKPVLPPLPPSDLKKQLNLLKPSRRTSSQYVASAIAKYTSDKPTSISKVSECSESLKSQTGAGFQRSGPTVQVTPLSSSHPSLSNNTSAHIFHGSKRPVSPSKCVSPSQRGLGEVNLNKDGVQSCAMFKESSNVLYTEMAKNNHSQYNGSVQKSEIVNNKDYIKHVQHRSSSPPKSSTPQPSSQPLNSTKITSQKQINGTTDTTQDNLKSSTPVSNSYVAPGPGPVTVFGPIKKFRPVICRSVEKETSLHSSLMEAIQTGGGRDRLKKISSGPCNQDKVTYVDEENERSALLAAIRAQNISRLKKTNSEAATELEQFRTVTSDEGQCVRSSPSPPPLTCSSPGFTSPPSPPPPPILPQSKPNSVFQIKAKSSTDPALAREAMLEAIRSGAGAGKLKKVSVPRKTVQVNGRLGTIQASSSTVPQQ